jgi:hypothetical protein
LNSSISPQKPPDPAGLQLRINFSLLMYWHSALSLHTHQAVVYTKHRVICQTGYNIPDKHTASILEREVYMVFGLTPCSLVCT